MKMIKYKQNPTTKGDFDLSNDSKKLFVCSKDMVRLCWPMLLSSTKEYETYSE